MPSIGRFASADTMVPSPGNPQSFNRYSYVLNNPVKYSDPFGYSPCEDYMESCVPASISEDLPDMGDRPDVTIWLYRQMILNAHSREAKGIRELMSVVTMPDSITMGSAGLFRFKDMVDYGQPWDFKEDFEDRDIEFVTIADQQYRMDIVANIHYGYIGNEVNIADWALLAFAGLAQQLGPDPEQGEWHAFFDEPVDQNAIQLGIDISEYSKGNLTLGQFTELVDRYAQSGMLDEYLGIDRQ